MEQIEWMNYETYKKSIYYLNHPEEYAGDFELFVRKIVDYSNRVQSGEVFVTHYQKILQEKADRKKAQSNKQK